MKSFLFLAALTLGMTVQAQDIKEGETLQEITVKGSKVVQHLSHSSATGKLYQRLFVIVKVDTSSPAY